MHYIIWKASLYLHHFGKTNFQSLSYICPGYRSPKCKNIRTLAQEDLDDRILFLKSTHVYAARKCGVYGRFSVFFFFFGKPLKFNNCLKPQVHYSILNTKPSSYNGPVKTCLNFKIQDGTWKIIFTLAMFYSNHTNPVQNLFSTVTNLFHTHE